LYFEPIQFFEGSYFLPDGLFLLAFLFQVLPQVLHRTSVTFNGALLETIKQDIEVTNNSNKPVVYDAELTGSEFFTLNSSIIEVPAKSSATVSVEFKSKFAKPATASLKLKSRSIGLNLTSILIFDLVASVEQLTSLKTFQLKAPMYSANISEFKLNIKNIFDKTAKFKVTMLQKKV
jgi:hypothetical protein